MFFFMANGGMGWSKYEQILLGVGGYDYVKNGVRASAGCTKRDDKFAFLLS